MTARQLVRTGPPSRGWPGSPRTRPSAPFAVTGGTGAYRGATGTMSCYDLSDAEDPATRSANDPVTWTITAADPRLTPGGGISRAGSGPR